MPACDRVPLEPDEEEPERLALPEELDAEWLPPDREACDIEPEPDEVKGKVWLPTVTLR
jgi:hypothetical protein